MRLDASAEASTTRGRIVVKDPDQAILARRASRVRRGPLSRLARTE